MARRGRSLPTVDASGDPSPEAPVVALQGRGRSGILAHRVGVGLLAVFVVAGLSGFLGVKSGTARASSGGIELEVRYGHHRRPHPAGRHPGGTCP